MKVRLELKTVQGIEKTLRSGDPSHRREAFLLLQKWRNEVDLEKAEETERLIEQLITDYSATNE